jgi:hypothetical protein
LIETPGVHADKREHLAYAGARLSDARKRRRPIAAVRQRADAMAHQQELSSRMEVSIMKQTGIFKAAVVLGFYALTTALAGCVVAEPREGYYDHGQGRYYHAHAWVTCGPGDPHCR